MILVIDNYDSFTYNLVQYLGEICLKHKDVSQEIKVFRNDKITVDKIKKLRPKYIIISPGPSTPQNAGISVDVVKTFAGKIPILGVCLGHQCIIYAFGGRIVRAKEILHGKVSDIYHDGKTIFTGLPNPFVATRYHSLIGERKSLPKFLEISATTKDGIIMGVRVRWDRFGDKHWKNKSVVEGVQFHPESILTTVGKTLLLNFLRLG